MTYRILVIAFLTVGVVFLGLALSIVAAKAWRETRDSWRRLRRRALEPLVLAYAHGSDASLLPALGGLVRRRDRRVLEWILLDIGERVRGIERERLGRAMDELGYVDEYLRELRSTRWWSRARAAERLGLAGSRRAVVPLIGALDDRVYDVRLRAARSLGVLGGPMAVRPLIGALSEPNRWSTIRIADILATMGPSVVTELIHAFPDLNLHARRAALEILGRIGSPHAAVWLRTTLPELEPELRPRACGALGAIGGPEAGPALTGALRDSSWPVRAMAAKALGRLKHAAAVPELCGVLRDEAWWVRTNAAEALRGMGEPGIEALRRMLYDRDAYARHQAVLMLEEAGVLDDEAGRLVDTESDRRDSALALVGRLVQVGQIGRLRELAELHPDPRVREVMGDLLPEEGGREEATH